MTTTAVATLTGSMSGSVINEGGSRWEYVAEGNANIILSDLTSRAVIRLRKETKEVKDNSQKPHKNENLFLALDEWNYIEFVLKRLVPNTDYFLDVSLAPVAMNFLQQIDTKILQDRPASRRSKHIDSGAKNVMLMPHLGFLCDTQGSHPSIFVEIKPKCGFLPLAETYHPLKSEVCRFCMHQVTKLRTGKVNEISEYCPLNLFSERSCCVRDALECLFRTPQNNLRIHVDGILVPADYFTSHSGNITHFTSPTQLVDVLLNILLDDSVTSAFGSLNSSVTNTFCLVDGSVTNESTFSGKCIRNKLTSSESRGTFSSSNAENMGNSVAEDDRTKSDELCNSSADIRRSRSRIPGVCQSSFRSRYHDCNATGIPGSRQMGKGGILRMLHFLQSLDTLDIESIHSMYVNNIKLRIDAFDDLENFESAMWQEAVNSINDLNELERDVVHICRFLISATFKDCSIGITFQKRSGMNLSRNSVYCENTDCYYDYQLKLIDVDPRHVSNIPYYFHVDQDIVANYISAVNT